MTESYVYIIVALLPLAATMLVLQTNPYHALVTRGILGAVSALVYAVLGAADVALTEAMVGTLLSITLYAVAVRSSLVMRLGVLKDGPMETDDFLFKELVNNLRAVLGKHYLRLELVSYPDTEALHQALMAKEIHATCVEKINRGGRQILPHDINQPYQTITRVQRLYDILQAELLPSATSLVCTTAEISPSYPKTANSAEAHS
ncbi:MAG TPA: DUF4040 domain-containing protein [Trichocoleus sp.]